MKPNDPDGLDAAQGRSDQAQAWDAFGLVASGVAVWGGVGWLVSEWLNSRVYLMLGLMVGMGAALYLVWAKYGRS